jgi:serine/threonine protein kinase
VTFGYEVRARVRTLSKTPMLSTSKELAHCVSITRTEEDQRDLYSLIEENPNGLPRAQTRSLFRQLLSALAALHREGVVHRDVKPENCLLSENDTVLRLTGFEFATQLDEAGFVQGRVGTLDYVAPEVALGRPYTEKCDIWSAGVVLQLLRTGRLIYRAESWDEVLMKAVAHPTENYNPLLNLSHRCRFSAAQALVWLEEQQ